ncbi:hypothetical protein [Desulfomicrobium escambiense]|uniref:hypothetical protein n=1 Tax=Desulfomicrobium escambiense TaxID=29503 RepID=UPI0004909EA1|nr:hypothetical protein [Desulfomicrobium escambiense]
MKTAFALLACLVLAAPALAGPWVALAPVTLSASGAGASLPVGEKMGKIDNLRFQIDGATVQLNGLVLVPVKGDPIPLKIPVQLKSGESSGLINIPGPAVAIDKLTLDYRITDGRPAAITLRVKQD